MKKSIFIFILLLTFFNPNLAHAQNDQNSQEQTASQAATPTYIKYDLAFPGMLPDNPLYKLKTLRSKIYAFLIADPVRKMDFYLKEADKGILAAAILIDKKKFDLADQTALKAEHNMTLLVTQFRQLPKKPDDALFEKVITASKKHQEVLESLIKRVPENNADTLKKVLNFSKSNLETIEKYKRTHPKRWKSPEN